MSISGRRTGGVILTVAVVVLLLTQNLIGAVIAVTMAVVSAFFLIAPPSPEFYVETKDDALIVKVVTRNTISLRDIRSVEPHRPEHPAILRGFLNLFLSLGNLFGGGHELIGSDDKAKDVIVRFKKWVWILTIVPPFLIPRKNWVLLVEDAETLRQDLLRRLAKFE